MANDTSTSARPRDLNDSELLERWLPVLERAGLDVSDTDRLARIAALMKRRARTLEELTEVARFFFEAPTHIDSGAAKRWLTEEQTARAAILVDRLRALELSDWRAGTLESLYCGVSRETGSGIKPLAQMTRVALTGGARSPGVFETMEVVGKERCVERLEGIVARALLGGGDLR